MDKDSQLILLASNVEKLEKLLDDLVDNHFPCATSKVIFLSRGIIAAILTFIF